MRKIVFCNDDKKHNERGEWIHEYSLYRNRNDFGRFGKDQDDS